MNYSMTQRTITLVSLLWASFSFGCMTVVRPISTSEPITTDGQHEILFGDIQLKQNVKMLLPFRRGRSI